MVKIQMANQRVCETGLKKLAADIVSVGWGLTSTFIEVNCYVSYLLKRVH